MPTESETTLLQLSDWGLLGVSGTDATEFLHGQFTNDLESLPECRAQLSAYCLPQGQTIATFLIWRDAEQYRILLPKDVCERVLGRLQMFRLRSDVALVDQSDSYVFLGQHGTSPDSAVWPDALPQSALEMTCSDSGIAIRWPGVGARWMILLPAETELPTEITADTEALWRRWDIADGLPFIREPNCERFVPQHINLDLLGAISFSKGCYPGQEVVARMHYRGRIKHRVYRFGCDGEAIDSGAEIWPTGDSRACGHVVSSWAAPDGSDCELLASIRIEDAAGSLRAHTADGANLSPLPLPYEHREPTADE